jgi:Carboxypeptidase regulatory-like domain
MQVSQWKCAAMCVLLHGFCGAQSADVPIPAAADSATVRGSVANLLTGAPVDSAKVMIVNADGSLPPTTVLTGDLGVFSFPALAPGDYRLWVERTGFEAQQFGAKSANADGTTLSLRAGQIIDDITFRLLPHGSVSGKIADSDGNPVSGVQVQAIRFIAGAVPVIQPVGWAISAKTGDYRIADIAPGRYYLLATPPAKSALESELLAPAYYPDSPDLARAMPISAPAGVQTTDVDFVLHPARFSTVRGRVMDESGAPLSDSLRLVLTSRIPGCTGATDLRSVPVDRASGAFAVTGVPPGDYVLTAAARDSDAVLEGRAIVEVGDSDVNDVQIAVTQGVAVSGRLTFEAQRPGNAGRLQITLSALDAFAVTPALTSPVSQDAFEFRFDRVAPGRWTLDASGLPANAYIKSISIGGAEVPDRSLDISLVSPGAVEVIVGMNAGRLEGMVKDLSGSRRASLVMVPAEQRTTAFRSVKTAVSDAAGRFTMDGIAPGDYRLFAFEEADFRQLQDSAFLDFFEKSATSIHVGAGATVNVEIAAIPAEVVSAQNAAGF